MAQQSPFAPTHEESDTAPRLVADNHGLVAQNLGKSFKKRPVLRDVSFYVQRGEAVGLLGPNGAGKTTSFYIIMGLIAADVGSINLDGAEITHLPMYQRARLGIGYLPQEPSIFRGLTVEENIRAVLEVVERSREWRDIMLDDLLADPSQPQPDGVFWWSFYTKPNADEFFESALKYISGGRIDPRDYPSSNAKAHLIAGMIRGGRYLFILDGLEIMQHQKGDQYGLLKSSDLRDFLNHFDGPEHDSFCLITSRTPVLDLIAYTPYTHRDVARLSASDGRALLRKVGVRGKDEALDKVVADWDGHALTLSLLGGCVADQHSGDVAYIDEILPPTMDDHCYQRVRRVLRRYDEHLTDPERAFLMLFSAFRTPVEESTFERVFRGDVGPEALNTPIAALDDTEFEAMLGRLRASRILRYDKRARHYTSHPLIRSHYLARLTQEDCAGVRDLHQRIKDHYLQLAGDTPRNPTLGDLAPLIEMVHHACQAGDYDEAERIRWERIDQRYRFVLQHQLSAVETTLALMREFFPDENVSQEPLVSDPKDKSLFLNLVGVCLMNLGRLWEAVPFYKRSTDMDLAMRDWNSANASCQNLAELHAHLGSLAASADAAREALAFARRARRKNHERNSLALQAWAAHLRGDTETADKAFGQAETLEKELDSKVRYLYSLRGIQHSEHLRHAGNAVYARRVTESNLEICERNHFVKSISQCHHILGDLDADSGQHESAREHYDEALRIARGITFRPALIEALLARGLWYARHGNDAPAALSDLKEALEYATQCGYRIYETDIRVALAWAHLAVGNPTAARAEAQRSLHMSTDMGYHWGQVNAEEVERTLGV